MGNDLQSLELELETQLLTKASRLAEQAESRGNYLAQRINGAVWLKQERALEKTLAELHVKISALEAKIAVAKSAASDGRSRSA
jgi:hypothetical protein